MEKLENVVRLMAKTGLFFANCDGQYAQQEKDFIEGFIAQIEQIGTIDETLKKEVAGAIDHQYTLEEIVQNTQEVLDGFNSDEQKAILMAIDGFAKKVIKADKRVAEAENANHLAWKKHFGLD